jgi:hypothetical protein
METKLFSYLGRKLLVKMVVSVMLTHFLTVYKPPKWAIRDVDHFRRSFLGRGDDPNKIRGGHCVMKWRVCNRPKKWGGLGIKYLDMFGTQAKMALGYT